MSTPTRPLPDRPRPRPPSPRRARTAVGPHALLAARHSRTTHLEAADTLNRGLVRPLAIPHVPLHRALALARGPVRLRYALDDEYEFVEELEVPVPEGADLAAVEPILDLLHWVAGVSYYKTAAPPAVVCERRASRPGRRGFLEALYSEGLGEFAVVNALPALPRPVFPRDGGGRDRGAARARARARPGRGRQGLDRGAGDRAPLRAGLHAVLRARQPGDAADGGGARRAEHVVAQRRLPLELLGELNRSGALNGHVPITAIVVVRRAADRGAERLRRGDAGQRAVRLGRERRLRRHRGQPPVLQERARRGAAARRGRPRPARP